MASRIIGKINIDDDNLKHDVSYLNSVTKLPEEYDEFGQGYWKNISIYNASGNASDSQYRQTDRLTNVCLPNMQRDAQASKPWCCNTLNLKI